jgi:hypothetical protein
LQSWTVENQRSPIQCFYYYKKFKKKTSSKTKTTEANKGLSQIQFRPHAKDMILPTS